MYGSIIADIVSSRFRDSDKSPGESFELFTERSSYTGFTVQTIAVMEATINVLPNVPKEKFYQYSIRSLLKWCTKYPDAGYHPDIERWIIEPGIRTTDDDAHVRVSPIAWLYCNTDSRFAYARAAAMPSSSKQILLEAELLTGLISMAVTGSSKADMDNFFYDTITYMKRLDHPADAAVGIKDSYTKRALDIFRSKSSFEDTVRTAIAMYPSMPAVSVIAGAIAEAFYGTPPYMKNEARMRLPDDMLKVLDRFESSITMSPDANPLMDDMKYHVLGNAYLKEKIREYNSDPFNAAALMSVLEAFRVQLSRKKCLLVPVYTDKTNLDGSPVEKPSPVVIKDLDGRKWFPAYTDIEQAMDCSNPLRGSGVMYFTYNLEDLFDTVKLHEDIVGILVRAGECDFHLTKPRIASIRFANNSFRWDIPEDDNPLVCLAREAFDTREAYDAMFGGNTKLEQLFWNFRRGYTSNSAGFDDVLEALAEQARLIRYFVVPIDTGAEEARLLEDGQRPDDISTDEWRNLLPSLAPEEFGYNTVPVFTDPIQYANFWPEKSGLAQIIMPMDFIFRLIAKWGTVNLVINPGSRKPFTVNSKNAMQILDDL